MQVSALQFSSPFPIGPSTQTKSPTPVRESRRHIWHARQLPSRPPPAASITPPDALSTAFAAAAAAGIGFCGNVHDQLAAMATADSTTGASARSGARTCRIPPSVLSRRRAVALAVHAAAEVKASAICLCCGYGARWARCDGPVFAVAGDGGGGSKGHSVDKKLVVSSCGDGFWFRDGRGRCCRDDFLVFGVLVQHSAAGRGGAFRGDSCEVAPNLCILYFFTLSSISWDHSHVKCCPCNICNLVFSPLITCSSK